MNYHVMLAIETYRSHLVCRMRPSVPVRVERVADNRPSWSVEVKVKFTISVDGCLQKFAESAFGGHHFSTRKLKAPTIFHNVLLSLLARSFFHNDNKLKYTEDYSAKHFRIYTYRHATRPTATGICTTYLYLDEGERKGKYSGDDEIPFCHVSQGL